jgi:Pectate lyase superfamily protein
MPFLAGFVTPQDYGAVGNGVTDDTAAIQAAINAVNTANSGNGGQLFFPPATYAVTPVSSTSAALVLNNGTTGYTGVRMVGSSEGGSHLLKLANGPIFNMSGPSTDLTGNTHAKYCSLENLYLDGNTFTGTMLQTYYADNLSFHNVHFVNNYDIVQDTAEFWDSRYYNCVWEGCGSLTNSASTPNVLLRDSAASSGFGFSTDSVNGIHFVGCRWEGFRQGAVWIQQGVSNSSNPNGLFFVNCKMESSVLRGGPHFSCDSSARGVFVDHLYCYSGGFSGTFSTAQDVITWNPNGASSLNNVFISNRAATSSIANGVTISSNLAGQSAVARNVVGMYNTAPTGAHINFSTATGTFIIDNCVSTLGTAFANAPAVVAGEVVATASSAGAFSIVNTTAVTGNTNADLELVEATSVSQALGMRVTGDTVNRFLMLPDGTMKWGPGSGAIDASVARTSAGTLTYSTNVVMSGITYLNAGSATAGSAPVLTPTFASGTAAQLSDTTRDYMVYFQIGTVGTGFILAIGPANTTVNTIMTSATPGTDESISFRLPAGWWVKWSGTGTLASQKAIGC